MPKKNASKMLCNEFQCFSFSMALVGFPNEWPDNNVTSNNWCSYPGGAEKIWKTGSTQWWKSLKQNHNQRYIWLVLSIPYLSNWIISPGRGESKTNLKPSPSTKYQTSKLPPVRAWKFAMSKDKYIHVYNSSLLSIIFAGNQHETPLTV